jgi:predicted MFS family arabinose efflux permease
VQALTALTLAARFASTIFAPLTSALTAPLGWRGTYLVLAGVLAAITIPAHAVALRLPWTPPRAEPGTAGRRLDRQVLASRPFVLLATAAALCAFAQYAALVNHVPLLTRRGLPTGLAAWALGLGGAGQVAGRLCYRPLVSRLAPKGRTVAVIAAGAAVTLLLGLLPGPAATLVADYWGAGRYAVVNGVFNAPLTAAGALATSAGAAIAAATGSYPVLFAILAGTAAAGAGLAATTPPPTGRRGGSGGGGQPGRQPPDPGG